MKQVLLLISIVISLPVFSQNFSWAESWGSANNNDIATAISTAPNGNVLVTGYFYGTIDFDPGPGVHNLTAEFEDAFISCTSPSGTLLWIKQFGGDSIQRADAIAHDSDGNSYITGLFQGTSDFNPSGSGMFNMTTNRSSVYICKLDPNGNFVWAKQLVNEEELSASRVYGIAVNANQVCITGTFRGAIDCDSGPATAILDSGSVRDMYIVNFDTDGNYLWAKQIMRTTTTQIFEPASISTDAAGNVYTTGKFDGTIDFDPGTGVFNLVVDGIPDDVYVSVDDAFICKLDNNGNFVWAKQLAGADFSLARDIATDGPGNIYATGYFMGSVDFDPGIGVHEITALPGSGNGFVVKLDTDGELIWVKTTLTLNESITLDAAGNNYAGGTFGGTVDFDPSPATFYLSTAGIGDAFISKLDSDGNFIWARKFGGPTEEMGVDVAVDASQNVYSTGLFSGTADFDPGIGYWPLNALGTGYDSYLAKLSNCVPDTGTDFISRTCGSTYTWPVNGTTYDESGVYHYLSVNSAGCDSVLSLELDIPVLLPSVVFQNGDTLFAASQEVDSYQWINCPDGSPIPGETHQVFVPSAPGLYAVTITLGGCTSTSGCANFGSVGLEDPMQEAIRLYPNPVRDKLTLSMSDATAEMEVRAINGQLVFTASGITNGGKITTQNWLPGIYLVKISTENQTTIHRVVKE